MADLVERLRSPIRYHGIEDEAADCIEALVRALEQVANPLRLEVDGIGLNRTLALIARMSSIAKDALARVGGVSSD